MGVEQNYRKAAKWWRKAAEQGHKNAQYNLGLAYDNGKGVEKDHSAAMEWYHKAAEQGNKDAQNALDKVEQSDRKMAQQIPKVAEQEHKDAQNALDKVEQSDRKIAQQIPKAVEEDSAILKAQFLIIPYYISMFVA